jgi:hypothetical protein
MPERSTLRRARTLLRRGRAPSTAAGEFIREEIHHVREGKHGVRSVKQAIAIGLAKARRAGVPLPVPKGAKGRTQRAMRRAYIAGRKHRGGVTSRERSVATSRALRKEPHRGASHRALAAHAHAVAKKRTHRARSASAKRGARTKGPTERRAAARKAARTRAKHAS